VVRLAFVIAALTTVAVGYWAGATSSRAAGTQISCGVERWSVKTLQDRPLLRPARTVTIRYLVTGPRPSYLGDRRTPFERNVFTVVAAVTLDREEDDEREVEIERRHDPWHSRPVCGINRARWTVACEKP
jgi:hypothetical protein